MILQDAQARWVDGEHGNQWRVVSPSGEELARLPECITEAADAMGMVHFGRGFELKAFGDGVKEGLRRGSNASKVHRQTAQAKIKELEEMNATLATQLERHIIEG